MHTQFDTLVLSADHKTITASGAISWDAGDQHCRVSVVLTQNGGAIEGSGNTGNYNTSDPAWECTVPVSTPHNGTWDPSGMVHCVGTTTPSSSWPPQDLPLQVQAAASA